MSKNLNKRWKILIKIFKKMILIVSNNINKKKQTMIMNLTMKNLLNLVTNTSITIMRSITLKTCHLFQNILVFKNHLLLFNNNNNNNLVKPLLILEFKTQYKNKAHNSNRKIEKSVHSRKHL